MGEIKLEKFEIPTGINDKIIGDIRYPKNFENSLPISIIIHGFTGHKDWGFLPYLSEKVAGAGFVTLVPNFSTDIVDPIQDFFTDVEKFSTFTISQWVSELGLLIENIRNKRILNDAVKDLVDTGRIFLIGQSLGGAVSMIYASTHNAIQKLCLLGSVGTLFRYTQRQIEEWAKTGFILFTNSRTGQELNLNFSYYRDIVNNNYALEKHLSQIKVPVLFIHGSEDLTVPLKEIQNLINLAKNPLVKLIVLPNTNHTFGIEHPFTKPTEALDKVIETTIRFLKNEEV
jgi:pimeloyl-ACP methyl ester carboxylesterase